MPIPYIHIAITHRLTGQRTDATSGSDGSFQISFPGTDGPGPYIVEVVGYDCRSPVMDANCKLAGYIPPANIESIPLPQETEVRFIFQSVVAPQPPAQTGCPAQVQGQSIFEDPHMCFFYPVTVGYSMDMGALDLTVSGPPVGGPVEPVTPFYTISIYDSFAGTATAQQEAEKWAAENGLGGFPLQYQADTLGGYPALKVLGEPGIAARQRVFVVVKGVAYTFYLWPIDIPVAAPEVSYLWSTLVNSIYFK